MDLSKRANLRNVREVRLAGPSTSVDSQWRVDPGAVEFRDSESDHYTFRGEASVVGHTYEVNDAYGTFEETIRAGAFDKTLRENPDVSFVYMHDMATVMASTRSGGLKLSASPHLGVEAMLPKNDVDVQRFAPKALRGDAGSMSFAFRVMGQNWSEDFLQREITEVSLHRGDVSALPNGIGANPAAWGTLRADELELAFRAVRDGSASDEQMVALRALIVAPEEVPAEEAETPEIDPDEARLFMERLMRIRERAREADAA